MKIVHYIQKILRTSWFTICATENLQALISPLYSVPLKQHKCFTENSKASL
jgi:hypothetical protein